MSAFCSNFAAKKEMIMKVGIYGGSFNPVHWGHKGMIKWVLEHTDLDEVWMLVSPQSPHKVDRGDLDTNYAERVAAAREAVKDLTVSGERLAVSGKKVVVSDFEDGLPRPSYTANTLRELRKAYPEHEFSLIIGEDNWRVFDKWREYEYILENYRVFVYPRRENTDRFADRIQNTDNLGAKNVVFLREAPYFDISSTEIREKMQK